MYGNHADEYRIEVPLGIVTVGTVHAMTQAIVAAARAASAPDRARVFVTPGADRSGYRDNVAVPLDAHITWEIDEERAAKLALKAYE